MWSIGISVFTLYNNEKECQIDVVVSDDEDPTWIRCQEGQSIVVQSDAGSCSKKVSWISPHATDNDPAGATITKPTRGSGDVFAVSGTPYDISYKATDPSDNSAYCNFTVTVNDETAPVFTPGKCKAEFNLYEAKCGEFGTETTTSVTWACPATDSCDGETDTVFKPWAEVKGAHTFHPTHPDTMSKSCTDFDFTDIDAALASCIGSEYCYTVEMDAQICALGMDKINEEFALTTSNKLWYYNSDIASGTALFPIPPSESGISTHYVITATSTDSSNNEEETTISFEVVDGRTKPRFVRCPSETIYLNLSSEDSALTIPGGFLPPLHTTDCGTTMAEARGMDETTPLSEGKHAFYYTATDQAGNFAECKFDVVVRDINDIYWVGCPNSTDANVNVVSDDKLLQYQIVDWTTPKIYKRGVEMTTNITYGPPSTLPGMAFPLGITKVTYTVDDHRLNMTHPLGDYTGVRAEPICEFYVTVDDIERPKFTGWSERAQCTGDQVGVPLHDFCGGSYINVAKTDSFRTNEVTSVSDATADCCVGTCQPYKGSAHVSICME